MITSAQDAIGERGEAIFKVAITAIHGSKPYFWAVSLGEKWPSADFFVELVGLTGPRMFFFVSVKSTRRGVDGMGRLRVGVSAEDLRRLHRYPAPTYIAGVDEKSERTYLVSANDEKKGRLSSMSTAFPLDFANRELLREEVRAFWKSSKKTIKSKFVDKGWK